MHLQEAIARLIDEDDGHTEEYRKKRAGEIIELILLLLRRRIQDETQLKMVIEIIEEDHMP